MIWLFTEALILMKLVRVFVEDHSLSRSILLAQKFGRRHLLLFSLRQSNNCLFDVASDLLRLRLRLPRLGLWILFAN